ncbi:1-deoxy-D-xylulose 5-phosphate reductoisomerase [uncultured delta proteobacterium]|uniref:1-deoxy-D-xylulose 5-phosphate reductoisomerase n=1 Tax=uncultured delta proteobacterium TaxID=34034 RepID=A0A212JPN0_9DELT|nr:1-deoxy-D-xylulose 5-phosphate reductoisomerase [uncultured delta proteobacterium]
MIAYISPLPETALPFPRAVAVMGSTGSIGVSTLAVMAVNPGKFTAKALAAGRNAALLAEQAITWRPAHLAVLDDAARDILEERLAPLRAKGYAPTIHVGPEGYAAIASLPEADIVVSAQVGAAGLAATYAAVSAGKTVALANKESLVMAGDLLRAKAAQTGAVILPVDSEHNAIFQCLARDLTLGDARNGTGRRGKSVSRLLLTASGGPFRGRDASAVENATPAMALAHPNWSMGAKITIDSATMMNKGLEVIEACHLYGVAPEAIEVLVHPQSVVHSLVEFSDASLLAQAGPPDMRIAISYCLGWPERTASGVPVLDLTAVAALTFEKPDLSVFRCLALAREALLTGGAMPVVLNAANEIAVDAFLSGRISFGGIARLVEAVMNRHAATGHGNTALTALEEIMACDGHARILAQEALP